MKYPGQILMANLGGAPVERTDPFGGTCRAILLGEWWYRVSGPPSRDHPLRRLDRRYENYLCHNYWVLTKLEHTPEDYEEVAG